MNVTEDIYTEQDNLLGRIDLYVEIIKSFSGNHTFTSSVDRKLYFLCI